MPAKMYNNYEIIIEDIGYYVLVELTQGLWAKCDIDEWFNILIKHKWCASFHKGSGYFYAKSILQTPLSPIKRKTLFMHRLVLGVLDSKRNVDHKDHDTLNNRNSNLRECSSAQNNQNRNKKKTNTSGYTCVTYCKIIKKWRVRIGKGLTAKQIGYYESKEEAGRASDLARLKDRGEFCGHLNFPHLRELYNKEAK
jgi:hypothetical protein